MGYCPHHRNVALVLVSCVGRSWLCEILNLELCISRVQTHPAIMVLLVAPTSRRRRSTAEAVP